MSTSLPSTLWTLSTCICDTLPHSWALPWSQDSPAELDEARQLLGLAAAEFQEMREQVEHWRLDGRYGWPNVFRDLAAAREFGLKYCLGVSGVRLLGIALPASRLERFLNEAQPFTGQSAPGVFEAISARAAPPLGGTPRGFEVLGYEHGEFHSFICNGLEREYAALGLQLNEAGLFDEVGVAERAAEFTNLDSTGAEPVPWDAWKVDEYDMGEAAA